MKPGTTNKRDGDESELDVLQRIVALLLSLADLAERVASRPSPVRVLVLWLLRPAETVARGYVLDLAQDTGVPTLPISISTGDSAADALHLARCFRILAFILDTLTALTFADPQAGKVRQDRWFPEMASRRSTTELNRCSPAYPDTS